MTQLGLFDRPLSRRADPATSHTAADKATEFKARHISLIWNALLEKGSMTPRQIAAITGLEYHAVQRRGKEMEDRKLIARGPDDRDGMLVWRGLR